MRSRDSLVLAWHLGARVAAWCSRGSLVPAWQLGARVAAWCSRGSLVASSNVAMIFIAVGTTASLEYHFSNVSEVLVALITNKCIGVTCYIIQQLLS